MKNGSPVKQNGDVPVLQEILSQFERAVVDYNAILAEVRAHQEQIAKNRTALAAPRRRRIDMREPVKRWDQKPEEGQS